MTRFPETNVVCTRHPMGRGRDKKRFSHGTTLYFLPHIPLHNRLMHCLLCHPSQGHIDHRRIAMREFMLPREVVSDPFLILQRRRCMRMRYPLTKLKMQTIERIAQYRCNCLPRTFSGFRSMHHPRGMHYNRGIHQQSLLRTVISFWDTQHAVFNFQGTELASTVKEYEALIQRPMHTRDIVVPNQYATIQNRLAVLLGLRGEDIRSELQYGWEHGIRTEWLIDFIHILALRATGESHQCDACYRFIMLIFGTILFPHASDLIDGALAQVVLQVIWFLAYIRPFSLSHPFSYITDERSLITRLLHVFQPFEHNYTDWRIFPPKRIALITGSCGQTLQLRSQRGFYEFEKLDA
ncbi:hypothetical protein CRG98_013683 [Punica granatum]|uniref:DUF7745 domain-containing protein n=1 Tax=Punica granatum TaxID=22663 RepID=A0A2I0KBL5_PUNGR|nr:hypothetical protein CRG98_013683 [Punica granatum]